MEGDFIRKEDLFTQLLIHLKNLVLFGQMSTKGDQYYQSAATPGGYDATSNKIDDLIKRLSCNQRSWSTIFVTLIMIGSLVGMSIAAWQIRYSISNSPSTIGTIINNTIIEGGECGDNYFNLIVKYNYTIKENVFHGTYVPDSNRCHRRIKLDEFLGKYPKNSSVIVFYDQYNPSRSSLTQMVDGGLIAAVVLTSIFSTIMIIIWFFTCFCWNNCRTCIAELPV